MSGNETHGVRAVVDGDGHLMEDAKLWIDYIEPGYRDVAPRLVADGDGARLMMDGRTVWFSPGLPGSSEPPAGWLPFGDARARESRT
jgi:hypothetical protein